MKEFVLGYVFLVFTFFASCKKDRCAEEIKPDCFCTLQYDPVCGCNGKTYGNSCEAECHGITDYQKGECP